MLTLAPGPSQISPAVAKDIVHATQTGILQTSHRSKHFSEISRSAIEGLREYLDVPNDYRIFYFDSASSVWHSLIANLVSERSFHLVNGAF